MLEQGVSGVKVDTVLRHENDFELLDWTRRKFKTEIVFISLTYPVQVLKQITRTELSTAVRRDKLWVDNLNVSLKKGLMYLNVLTRRHVY